MVDWSDIPSFNESEFTCKCGCGKTEMDESFVYKLQELRDRCGFPFKITSGYRCPDHPIEKAKADAGRLSAHSTGRAADIAVRGSEAYVLIKQATNIGILGLGVAQKGEGRFIHVDDLTSEDGFPRPWVWSY